MNASQFLTIYYSLSSFSISLESMRVGDRDGSILKSLFPRSATFHNIVNLTFKRQVVNICTICFNICDARFFLQGVLMCHLYVILRIKSDYILQTLWYIRPQSSSLVYPERTTSQHFTFYHLPCLSTHFMRMLSLKLPGNPHIGKFVFHLTIVVSLSNSTLTLYSFHRLCTQRHTYPSIAP